MKLQLLTLLWLKVHLSGADVNVYDQPMTSCGSSHADGCTYSSFDSGAHEVCVTKLPHGFSSDTGQGAWSNQYDGQPWCICIWAYSNYILQHKDLVLECKAIPSTVLEEQYSLDKFQQCGKMASTGGCGQEDIRRSIQSLCEQCDDQASDQTAKRALKTKCDAILSSAQAAPMRLYADSEDQEQDMVSIQARDGRVGMPLFLFCSLVIAVFVGMFVHAVLKRRAQHREELLSSLEGVRGDSDLE